MKCVYSGSFDPITNGHLNIIQRCAEIFDEVIVAVATNAEKHSKPVDIRCELVRKCVEEERNVTVLPCCGLIADFCRENAADIIVRGLRNNKDFEYESDMAVINRDLCGVETLFLVADGTVSHVNAGYVRELVRAGRSVKDYVPEKVLKEITEIYA